MLYLQLLFRSRSFRVARASLASALLVSWASAAALQIASPFGDHMVLQRDMPLPVWGMAPAGATIAVTFAGQSASAVAAADGRWRVELKPLAANGKGQDFVVTAATADGSKETRRFSDVLVGEVWLCGGQSNMERQLGLRPGQKPIVNWDAEAASATFPQIRQLYVAHATAAAPQEFGTMRWTVCTPESVLDFSAVGYFFARNLHLQLGVPVGIVHSSRGGTPAEAWTSADGLEPLREFRSVLAEAREAERDPAAYQRGLAERRATWLRANEPKGTETAWSDPGFDDGAWELMSLPTPWEEAGRRGFDGIAWFRRRFDLPTGWQGGDVELHVSAVDDIDSTWVNGVHVGSTEFWRTPRKYRVPGSALKREGNVVAVRVIDTSGNGGIWDASLPMEVRATGGEFSAVPLAGPWRCRFGRPFTARDRPPVDVRRGAGTPTVLYNAMIAPLVPFAIRGAAFYQGESNADRPAQYTRLLPALIADWRRAWSQPNLPFLFVQIAPFAEQPPEIREAQLIAWQITHNTAMVVTLDCGDPEDIHPAHKQPVGERLALAARALAYGEDVAYAGPLYAGVQFRDGRARIRFTHTKGGLVAKGGPLTGFTLAGPDRMFRPATAEIDGDTIVVSAPDVPTPLAVRYAWANAPTGNLFNGAGLPASPFRSDAP